MGWTGFLIPCFVFHPWIIFGEKTMPLLVMFAVLVCHLIHFLTMLLHKTVKVTH